MAAGGPLHWKETIHSGRGERRESDTAENALDSVATKSFTELKELLQGEPGIEALIDDAYLLLFLRFSKYDVTAALDIVKKYCALRTSAPYLFEGLTEPEKLRELTQDLITVLPRKNLHGGPVVLFKPGKWQPSRVTYKQMAQAQVLCLYHASRDPAAQTACVSLVSDFEGWSFTNMRYVELGVTRDYLYYAQNCLPAPVNETHIIRQPTSFNILYTFTRPFMSDEMVKTLRFHGKNLQRFHEDVPPDTLPREYGGTAPSTDWDAFWKNISQERTVDDG